MTGILTYSISELTLITIRCNTTDDIQKLEDYLFSSVKLYSTQALNPIFSVIKGKKSVL